MDKIYHSQLFDLVDLVVYHQLIVRIEIRGKVSDSLVSLAHQIPKVSTVLLDLIEYKEEFHFGTWNDRPL